MYQLTDKMVKKVEMTPEEVARYEGYLNDPEMHGIRQQIEVDLRKADAEHAAAEGRAKDAAAEAARREAELARRHRDPEPGTLPAVASAAPGGGEYGVVPGKVADTPIEVLRALMADPETTREVAEQIRQREAKISLAQATENLSDHQGHRLRQGLEDLDRLSAAVKRAYSSAKNRGYPTDVAVLLSSGVAAKEGFKYLFRQTARELVDTYSDIRESSLGVVPLAETCVEGFLYGVGVATKYGLLALTPVEDRAEYDAMARNVDATMQAMGQLTHYGLSSVLVTAGADRSDADKISEFTLKAMAVKGMIPGIKSVGGTLTRGIESIVRDYEIVYNPYVYSSGGFGSLTVNKKLPTTAPKVAEATVSEAPTTTTKVFDPTAKSFYDKVGEYGKSKYYRKKGSEFWYTKDRAGDRSHASTWKLYREDGKKIVKVAELDAAGQEISRAPSDTLKEIKLKDLAMKGGGK